MAGDMKNLRRGLRAQRDRAARELAEAQARGEGSDALQGLQRRVDWVTETWEDLDVRGLMVVDKPTFVDGVWRARGGQDPCSRHMTPPGDRMERGDDRPGGGELASGPGGGSQSACENACLWAATAAK